MMERREWLATYLRTRQVSEAICAPLADDDYQIQSIVETSPPKWHLGHVTWFFETFLLQAFLPQYKPVDPQFNYVFNSYYQTIGAMHPRPQRGLLSRPTVGEVYAYRAAVDERMHTLIETASDADWPEISARLALGLNHEQQHQELLFMDIKHNFGVNPLRPTYHSSPLPHGDEAAPLGWLEEEAGLREMGFEGGGFAFDNERPGHPVWLEAHRLGDRLVTNGEYLDFIEDGGYARSDLWLADGWFHSQQQGWQAPLYWEKRDGEWLEFTLHGLMPLDPAVQVCHTSYFEADAFARWAGKRLPLEAELENQLRHLPLQGHFSDSGVYHPRAGHGQWFGSLWEWTASPYTAYPRFQPLEGSMGEYNGKFMCNQWVLRGGACITPEDHMRATYRNFFYPHDRWQFSGIRLAEYS